MNNKNGRREKNHDNKYQIIKRSNNNDGKHYDDINRKEKLSITILQYTSINLVEHSLNGWMTKRANERKVNEPI